MLATATRSKPLSLIYARGGAWVRWVPGRGEEAIFGDELEGRPAARPERIDARPPPRELVLGAQFALSDDGGALRAYSPIDEAMVEVPSDLLPHLLSFETPKQADDDVTAWAFAKGFLVIHEAPKVIVSAPRTETKAQPPIPKLEPAASDGRLPVYLCAGPNPSYFPLALGLIKTYAERFEGGRLMEQLRFVPFVTGGTRAVATAFMLHGPGVFLMSDYMWTIDDNLAASKVVKTLSAKNVVVHGGPSAPKHPEASEAFLREHHDIDVIVRGEGERTAIELLDALGAAHARGETLLAREVLEPVAGLVFALGRGDDRRAHRTADRPRIEALDELPSPYLSGAFDGMASGMIAGTIETNRGCPYGCTFCDWGSATLQKIRKFDSERVRAEVEWLADRQIPILWIADANFGILDRDVELAEHIALLHEKTGFPREVVVNYAKNATLRVAEIVRTLTRAGLTTQGIISIQTRDAPTLLAVRRSNIKTKRYEELSNLFREEGLPLTIELMLGLPGSTIASLKADLQHYFDEDTPVRVYDTVVLPNSPMAEPAYMREHAIEIDERGYILATSSYSRDDLVRMDMIARLYRTAVDCSVLRLVLEHLQWDHGVPALEFLDALVQAVSDEPGSLPHVAFLLEGFRTHGRMRGGWGPLFSEIERFAADRFAVASNEAFSSVLRTNERILPEEGRVLPKTYRLAHDVVAYFHDRGRRPLASYGPGELTVSDPDNIVTRLRLEARPAEFIQHFWELESPLARVRAKAHFVVARRPAAAPTIAPQSTARSS